VRAVVVFRSNMRGVSVVSASANTWTFTKGEFVCEFVMPNAGRIPEKQLEDALPKQTALKKTQKLAREDPSLLMKMAISSAADSEFAFVAAAIIKPEMSVSDIRGLPGDIWEPLSAAIHKKLGTGLFRYRLQGPGESDGADDGGDGGSDGSDDLAGILGDAAR